MVIFDYAHRYPQATAELAGCLREGRLISREQILEGGVRAFHEALLKPVPPARTSASSCSPYREATVPVT